MDAVTMLQRTIAEQEAQIYTGYKRIGELVQENETLKELLKNANISYKKQKHR